MMKTGISNDQFKLAACKIGCEVEMIQAVDKIESQVSGFLPSGEVKILFEPHIFWKYLKRAGLKPIRSKISYPVWRTEPYGKSSEQHTRLQKAVEINRDIALMSTSWGRFQIMGFNYKACGTKNIQEFINKIFESEASQLDLFVNYIINSNLDDELAEKDFHGFARGYNGALYTRNRYAEKLKAAYLSFKNK